MRVPVRNMAGETLEELDLRDDVFGIEPNVAVMHQALVRQLNNARLGTHETKTRGEVSGGGAKPWRQKGTGRARQGSIRAPQWKGGGVVFGPHVRSYEQKMNRKMRRLALRSALSAKTREDRLVVVDALGFETPRTKEMAALLARLGLTSVLVLLPEADPAVELSARNLQGVKTLRVGCLNVRDLLKYDYILMPREAVGVIETWLGTAA